MPDHIHMCLSIPPKYSVAHTIGLMSSVLCRHIHRPNPRPVAVPRWGLGIDGPPLNE